MSGGGGAVRGDAEFAGPEAGGFEAAAFGGGGSVDGDAFALAVAFGVEEFGAAAKLGAVIDDAPEFAKVAEGRDHGEEDNDVEGEGGPARHVRVADAEEQERDGNDLEKGLGLAEFVGLDGIAFGGGDAAEAADGEFASDEEDYEPTADGTELNEGDEGGGDEELVSDGIEEGTDGGDLFPAAGEVAVEKISGGGEPEDDEGDEVIGDDSALPVKDDALLQQRRHQKGDEEDAGQGETVWQIHRSRAVVEIIPDSRDLTRFLKKILK